MSDDHRTSNFLIRPNCETCRLQSIDSSAVDIEDFIFSSNFCAIKDSLESAWNRFLLAGSSREGEIVAFTEICDVIEFVCNIHRIFIERPEIALQCENIIERNAVLIHNNERAQNCLMLIKSESKKYENLISVISGVG